TAPLAGTAPFAAGTSFAGGPPFASAAPPFGGAGTLPFTSGFAFSVGAGLTAAGLAFAWTLGAGFAFAAGLGCALGAAAFFLFFAGFVLLAMPSSVLPKTGEELVVVLSCVGLESLWRPYEWDGSPGLGKPFGAYHMRARVPTRGASDADEKVGIVGEQTGAHLGEPEKAFLVFDRVLGDATPRLVARSRSEQQSDDRSDDSAHQRHAHVGARPSPAHDRSTASCLC